MAYRDEVYFQAPAEPEVPFDEEEFAGRLQRIRTEMARVGIDCLFLTSPESLYYVSGFLCMWYQTERPMEWPPSNGNAARAFFLGEPSPEVRECASRAAGMMDRGRECLRPNLPVRELDEVTRRYYEETGLWDSRGWVGGYEMGIALFPDWVGNFVYDPLAEKNADRAFEPGTAVNYEVQVFLPRHAGCFFAIETFLFGDEDVTLATEQVPYGLAVIE